MAVWSKRLIGITTCARRRRLLQVFVIRRGPGQSTIRNTTYAKNNIPPSPHHKGSISPAPGFPGLSTIREGPRVEPVEKDERHDRRPEQNKGKSQRRGEKGKGPRRP